MSPPSFGRDPLLEKKNSPVEIQKFEFTKERRRVVRAASWALRRTLPQKTWWPVQQKYRAPCAGISDGWCWRWGQIRVCHVKTQENIETEGTGTADTSDARYFAKDTDVGEHRLMYAPIFLSTDRVFVLFLTTYHFPWCCRSWLSFLHHTTHTAGTTFLFSREKYRGAKLRVSEVD
jgi:hypothetical protein